MNKSTNILDNIPSGEKEKIIAALGKISDGADLGRQAQYINDLLNFAEANGIPMQNAMRKCSGKCLTNDVIEAAKRIYEQSSSMDAFLFGMNESGIGGGNLHMKDGKIIAIYKNCYYSDKRNRKTRCYIPLERDVFSRV